MIGRLWLYKSPHSWWTWNTTQFNRLWGCFCCSTFPIESLNHNIPIPCSNFLRLPAIWLSSLFFEIPLPKKIRNLKKHNKNSTLKRQKKNTPPSLGNARMPYRLMHSLHGSLSSCGFLLSGFGSYINPTDVRCCRCSLPQPWSSGSKGSFPCGFFSAFGLGFFGRVGEKNWGSFNRRIGIATKDQVGLKL